MAFPGGGCHERGPQLRLVRTDAPALAPAIEHAPAPAPAIEHDSRGAV